MEAEPLAAWTHDLCGPVCAALWDRAGSLLREEFLASCRRQGRVFASEAAIRDALREYAITRAQPSQAWYAWLYEALCEVHMRQARRSYPILGEPWTRAEVMAFCRAHADIFDVAGNT